MNEIADILTRSLNGMRTDGWARDVLHNGITGGRCAQGAVVHVLNLCAVGGQLLVPSPTFTHAMDILDASMDLDADARTYVNETFGFGGLGDYDTIMDAITGLDSTPASGRVAVYNNSRTHFAQIEDWFTRAIALAQAPEVIAEAEKILVTTPELLTV